VDCARIVRDELGLDVPAAAIVDPLLDAISFTPYPDVAPALRELRAAGLRLIVVSNWDVSLHEALGATGLRALVDGALSSAEVGSAKPGGRIFALALSLAGVPAHAAWHVGDSVEADVGGARAAGVEPILIARGGEEGPAGVRRIASLAELPGLVT
jgi:putative hydrolase of the HAD superfamily